jgi:hypothetical protein
MRISQVGAAMVSLSSNVGGTDGLEKAAFVAVNVPLKLEDKADDDGPMVAQFYLCGGEAMEGKAIENRSSAGWLLFRIPRDLCPEGGSLTFCALVNDEVLWQREYRVIWRDRFPGLEPAA